VESLFDHLLEVLHNIATFKDNLLNVTVSCKHLLYVFEAKAVARLAEVRAEECGSVRVPGYSDISHVSQVDTTVTYLGSSR
jgi:hypothetical protein